MRHHAEVIDGQTLRAALKRLVETADKLTAAEAADRREVLDRMDFQLTCSPPNIQASILRQAVMHAAGIHRADDDARISIPMTMQVVHRGSRALTVFAVSDQQPPSDDPKLIELLKRALAAREQLATASSTSIVGQQKHGLTREARLSYLAPDIVGAIIAGRQPIELNARRLHRLGALPMVWAEQRQMLGFN